MKKITKLIGLIIAVMMVAGAFACAAPAATEAPAAPAIQEAPKAEAPKAEEAAPAEEAPVEEAAPAGIGPDMLLLPTMENMADKFPGSWDNYGLVGRMMLFSRLLRLNDKLEYLKAVGINASWKLLTGDLTAQIYGETADYNLCLAGLSAMAVEEAFNLYKNETVNSGVTKNVFPNDYFGVDALIDELAVCVDAARRVEILKEIQRIDSEEMLWNLPLYSLRNVQVINSARLNLPDELVLSNEWSNYERYLEKWSINAAE